MMSYLLIYNFQMCLLDISEKIKPFNQSIKRKLFENNKMPPFYSAY